MDFLRGSPFAGWLPIPADGTRFDGGRAAGGVPSFVRRIAVIQLHRRRSVGTSLRAEFPHSFVASPSLGRHVASGGVPSFGRRIAAGGWPSFGRHVASGGVPSFGQRVAVIRLHLRRSVASLRAEFRHSAGAPPRADGRRSGGMSLRAEFPHSGGAPPSFSCTAAVRLHRFGRSSVIRLARRRPGRRSACTAPAARR